MQGGRDWIAGQIYLTNLIRALMLLPAGDRVGIGVVCPYTVRNEEAREFGHVKPRYFAFHANNLPARKAYRAAQSLRHLKWPRSLEAAVRGARVVFPVQGSLGRTFPVPFISWIPDFQHKRLPQFFAEREIAGRNHSFRSAVADAAHIVVSSEDARKDLMQWFPTEAQRVSALPFVSVSTDEWYAEEPRHVAARFQLPDRFLAFPSQFWIHKNHRVLLEAIGLLRDRGVADICLVCTGHTGDYRHPQYFESVRQLIDRLGLQSHVRILGLLPRAVQIHLMRRAAAIVQPSLFEGWSALVEDARTLGKRLYLSDIPIHREQMPPDAVFFDPGDPEQLADVIAKDWPDLMPGPDVAKEEEARSGEQLRAPAFARLFLRIVDQATG